MTTASQTTQKIRVRRKLNGTWIALNGVTKVAEFGTDEAAAMEYLALHGIAQSDSTVQTSRGWKWSKNQPQDTTNPAAV